MNKKHKPLWWSEEILTEDRLAQFEKLAQWRDNESEMCAARTIRHYQRENAELHERYNQMVDEIRGVMRRKSYAGFVTDHDLYILESMLPPDAGEDEGKGITKANLLSQMKINIFSKSRSIEDDKSSTDAGEEKGK